MDNCDNIPLFKKVRNVLFIGNTVSFFCYFVNNSLTDKVGIIKNANISIVCKALHIIGSRHLNEPTLPSSHLVLINRNLVYIYIYIYIESAAFYDCINTKSIHVVYRLVPSFLSSFFPSSVIVLHPASPSGTPLMSRCRSISVFEFPQPHTKLVETCKKLCVGEGVGR